MERFMRESDAFSWYLEGDPVLRSIVVSVMWFDSRPDWDRFITRMDGASRLQPSFRQRPVEVPARLAAPRWTVDPDFDINCHIQRMDVPAGEGDGFVMEVARREAMTGFDPIRPLWRFTLIEGLDGGRAALVMKVHHSLMDGVGAMQLAFNLFDGQPDPDEVPPFPDSPAGERIGALEQIREYLTCRAGQTAKVTAGLALSALPTGLAFARRPVSSVRSALDVARSIGRTVAPVRQTLSPLMKDRGTIRYLDHVEVDLDEMRAAARAAGGTVNDTFLAAAAGGMRVYHEKHGAPVDRLRLMMPINLRTARDPAGGNRITLMRYEVPVGQAEPGRRITEIGRHSRAARHEPSIPYTNVIAGGLNLLPPALVGSIFKHVDFVASDVPGFPTPVYLAGAKVSKHAAFGPTTGTALNLTLLSYCGTCTIGVNVDAAAVPDPDVFIGCLRSGFDEVLDLGRRNETELDVPQPRKARSTGARTPGKGRGGS